VKETEGAQSYKPQGKNGESSAEHKGIEKIRRKGREQVSLSMEKGFPIWEALFISRMKGFQP
jgi:uncharacterized protein YpmB